MTATDHTPRETSAAGRPRRRWVPFAAAATAAALAAAAVVTAGGGSAGAATAPNAQSAGNFVDATLGGKPIDQILKLAFARAQNPGNVTDQNPLDVTVLNAINLPFGSSLHLPELLGINLGAANQTALAKSNGESRGSAGAVLNSGGVSVGGDNGASPADATIDLSASGIAGNNPIPIPGGSGSADALGGVKVQIGAVSSIARTPEFGPALADSWLQSCAKSSATCYQIASLDLVAQSPLLGQLLGTITSTLDSVLSSLATAAGNVGLPQACAFSAGFGSITLENGAIEINSQTGSLEIHLKNLLETLLGKDLNGLPPNFDLINFLLDYLSSPDGLAKGLQGVIDGITNPLADKFTACLTALQNSGPIGQVAGLLLTLTQTLTAGQHQLETTINGILAALAKAAPGGVSPLAPLADVLKKLLDIGVNVQPQVSSGDFKTKLDTNPKQGMTPPPVPYQHTVRALEVQLLSGAVTLALANSAAGPSHPTAPPSSSAPPSKSAPPTAIPTGVPAGQGTHGGSPVLPVTLLLLALVFAGGGAAAYRFRGRFNQH